ncbi:MAG: sulfite exporter TauE/SafE family protein [Nanoarchaeota archaeon]|nr:sulfite exporter TauE/SafE family protein [Nanoarchaeota archaeon]
MTAEIPILPVFAIVFLAALVRSTFGFGDALVGMPLLVLVTSVRNATPLMAFVGPTLAVLLLIKEWRRIDLRSALRLILSTLAGIPFGLFFLKRIDERVVNLVLAAVIILFSVYSLIKPGRLKLKSERPAVAFGFVAGILGAAYNTNGPPVIFYGALRGWAPESFRATLQGYFLPTGGAILIGQGLAGLWTKPVVTTYLYALPLILVAVLAGTKLSRKIPAGMFNRYVYGLMLVLGTVLLIKAIG